jgi:FAD/FMN-containing dehydrogenase
MDIPYLNAPNQILPSDRTGFQQGDPGAILIVEFARPTLDEIHELRNAMEKELRQAGLGYHFPLVTGEDINKVWALRKSGLGVLSNIPGDAKPVSLVEDTAVRPDMLPDYIRDIKVILDHHKLNCVFHAHIGTGELHMRPVINLKDPKGVELFRSIATEVAWLVKIRGSRQNMVMKTRGGCSIMWVKG